MAPVRPAARPDAHPSGPNPTRGAEAFLKTAFQATMWVAEATGPVVEASVRGARLIWQKLQPYQPQDFVPLLLGLILILYGGTFPVLIAAIEAFRIAGWGSTKRALVLLYKQYQEAMAASRKDDTVDEDRDGVADVLQMDTKALIRRKIAVFMKATNPTVINEGLQGLTAGLTAVIATLRMEFAQTVTLGVSLGDIFTSVADQVVRPILEKLLPADYHKWIGLAISYSCRSAAVTIAWWAQRLLSTLHSGVRGAQLVLYAIKLLSQRFNIHIPFDLSSSNPVFAILCSVIGGLGMYWQLMRGWALPFPLNILLFPLRIVEWVLYYFVVNK